MTLTELPRTIFIGDTVTWDETLSEYPAGSLWTLVYYFTSPTAHFVSTHLAVGDVHRVTIATAALESGLYQYSKKVDDGTSQFTLEQGFITIEPDLEADAAGVDRREYAEIALANIEAMLQGKATKDQTSYSLNGRALSRYSIDELNEWRAQLRIEVADIKAKARRKRGGKSHRNVHVSFNSAVP